VLDQPFAETVRSRPDRHRPRRDAAPRTWPHREALCDGRPGLLPYTEVYAAAKEGVIGFTRVLRSDYHGHGVSASVLILGAIRDAGQGRRMLDDADMKTSRHADRSIRAPRF
jgi:NAD(P)-dependent dehydrogenase (short-subunit alcohol dehydrogenase family)